jgi:hypothetical protein
MEPPYIFYDWVNEQMEKKGVEKDSMLFMAHPPYVETVQAVSRLISEPWLEHHVPSKTIEETVANVHELCIAKGYDVKYESVDIETLSDVSKQVLSFFMDLDKTPDYAAFRNFNIVFK